MDLTVPLQNGTEIKKRLFKLKPLARDGLLLNIHYSNHNTKIRFFHCCFHETSHVLAATDNDGHIYIVDFFLCKFWGLPKRESCTMIKFSPYDESEILCAMSSSAIQIINFDTGQVTGKLTGHKLPVTTISFTKKQYCLSASQYEAIIWDLHTNTKLQVLALDKSNSLKFIAFMPTSGNILACFKDDLIQIWNRDRYEPLKQLSPNIWKNFSVKTVAFSRNGQVMVIAGYLPMLAIFLVDSWKLTKTISLPENILTIKSVEFITQPFDGGCNKILSILSGHGVVYFYDIKQNVILSELTANSQIKRICCCPGGSYMACVMNNGDVTLYNLNQYVEGPTDLKVERPRKSNKIKLRECKDKIEVIKSEISDVLDTEKLRAILKEFGEYPVTHRLKIWETLMALPNNTHQYNTVINHTTVVTFKDLYSQYPLESKTLLKSLKKLLNNIVTWCPFFASVEYLPVFAFPFVKVFQNKPVACFEAMCTIILNWCQHWFEYYPLAPVNVLAMIENVLMEHDPELLHHFSSCNITSNQYAWTLLETAFSEVLTAKEWLVLWDHVLSNEPSFLLCAVVSYNMIHRESLLTLKTSLNVNFFFHNQNPNNIKKMLQKTYWILSNTSEKMHPRQYLEKFKSVNFGNYPLFIGYPKAVVDFQMENIRLIDNEIVNIQNYKDRMLQQVKKKWEACNCEKKMEETRRQEEMKQVCLERIISEANKAKYKREELQELKKMLGEEERRIFSSAYKKLQPGDHIVSPPCHNCWIDFQDESIKKYTKLLNYKYRIQELIDNDDVTAIDNEKLRKYQEKLNKEIDQVRKSLISPHKLKQFNLATNIVAVENLIKNIESQLNVDTEIPISSCAQSQIEVLQKEVQELEKGVSVLLELLHKNREKRQRTSSNKPRRIAKCDQKGDKSSSEGCHKTVRFSETS